MTHAPKAYCDCDECGGKMLRGLLVSGAGKFGILVCTSCSKRVELQGPVAPTTGHFQPKIGFEYYDESGTIDVEKLFTLFPKLRDAQQQKKKEKMS